MLKAEIVSAILKEGFIPIEYESKTNQFRLLQHMLLQTGPAHLQEGVPACPSGSGLPVRIRTRRPHGHLRGMPARAERLGGHPDAHRARGAEDGAARSCLTRARERERGR